MKIIKKKLKLQLEEITIDSNKFHQTNKFNQENLYPKVTASINKKQITTYTKDLFNSDLIHIINNIK